MRSGRVFSFGKAEPQPGRMAVVGTSQSMPEKFARRQGISSRGGMIPQLFQIEGGAKGTLLSSIVVKEEGICDVHQQEERRDQAFLKKSRTKGVDMHRIDFVHQE